MVGSSKILTVSYGTFSCTLEGFDDSFSTMKAIAEYFRDLAADDRYFGAEPATPDADMLARIAQREVSQQVEARRDDSGIVLKAGAAIAAVEDAQDADSAYVADTVEEAPAAADPQATDELTEETVQVTAADPMMPPAAEAPTAPSTFGAADLHSEDTYEEDEVSVEASTEAQPTEPSATDHADADSVAAKLQRIRAVVGRNASKVVEETPSVSDESLFAEPEFETEADVADDMELGMADLVAEDGLEDVASVDEETVEDTLEAELEASDAIAEVSSDAEEPAPVRARVIRMRRSEAIVPDADDMADLQSDNDIADEADDLAEAVETSAVVEDEDLGTSFDDLGLSAEAQEEAEQLTDLSKLDGDALAEAAMLTLEDSAQTAPQLSTLDDDAEADLQAELAALAGGEEAIVPTEAPLDLGTPISDAVEDIRAEHVEDVAAHDDTADHEEDSAQSLSARISGSPDDENGDMTRILSRTEEQMAAPETSRRRDAIAQLKAAVAATEADRELSRDASNLDGKDQAPFRDDLRQVVRPTRPIRPSSRAIDPSADERAEPAPLKLVASQRVDEADQPTEEQAVEVASVDAPAAPRATGFAGFAEEMGAQDLSDLLEAAAAYTSFVEGAEDFSRPQLMSKVKELSGSDYSREDGLRSFGTLLRQGRINKVRNGRFQISDETRFNPERRAG